MSLSTIACCTPNLWDAPRERSTRRVAMTLAFVAALHVAAWLLLGAPRLDAMAKRARSPQPIAIELLPAPSASLRAHSAPPNPTDRQRPGIGTQLAQARKTPRHLTPKQPAPAPDAAASPMTAPPGAPHRQLDWQSAIDSVSADRAFRYRSNAERAAVQTGTARPAEQRTAEDELKRRTASAAKLDCRTAHADMGLLALPMLAYDALDGSKCRW